MKRTLLSFFGLMVMMGVQVAAQSFNWVRPLGGTEADEAYAVAHVAGGDSYVTGMFNGTAQFGSTSLVSAGGKDMFLARLNAMGAVLWARRAGGPDDQGGHVVAADIAGNAVVAGEFAGTLDLGSAPLTATGNVDLFVAKYNSLGILVFGVHGGTQGSAQANSIQTDGTGNIYLCGRFADTLQFGAFTVISNGMNDAFVCKFDPFGNPQWLVRGGGAGEDDAKGLAVGPDGSVFIAGSFTTIAQFGAITVAAPGAGREIFVAKVNNSGAFQWAKSCGGNGTDQAYEVAADNVGNCFVTGFYTGTATFGTFTATSAGDDDAFVTKLSGTGNFMWVTSVGGAGQDRGYAVEVSPWGNVYFTGSFEGTASFGGPSFISTGDKDIFTVALDAGGAVAWANTAGGFGFDRGYGITTDGIGGVWITGTFAGTCAWGPHMHTSAGNEDAFVARIGAPVGVPETSSIPALLVAPNPASDAVEFTLPTGMTASVDVLLVDAVGHVVYSANAQPGARQRIDLSGMAVGVYLLRAGSFAPARIIKE